METNLLPCSQNEGEYAVAADRASKPQDEDGTENDRASCFGVRLSSGSEETAVLFMWLVLLQEGILQ